MVDPSNFELRESSVPEPAEGEFLVRNLYLSLDPAMRTWMVDQPSYVPPVEIGEVMRGACVSRVVESRHPDYSPGEMVTGVFGWQDFALSDGGGTIHTAAQISGKPASMGEGVVVSVLDALIKDFTGNLANI